MARDMVTPLQHQSADLARYSRQSWVTDPGRYAYLYGDLPNNLGEICHTLQDCWSTTGVALSCRLTASVRSIPAASNLCSPESSSWTRVH